MVALKTEEENGLLSQQSYLPASECVYPIIAAATVILALHSPQIQSFSVPAWVELWQLPGTLQAFKGRLTL